MKKTIVKVIACICAVVLVAACFTACGNVKANEIKLSTSDLSLKAGDTTYFVIVANYEDTKNGTLTLDNESTDTEGTITEITVVSTSVSEESTVVCADFESETEVVEDNLDLGDSVYLVFDDASAKFTAADLGEANVNFIKENFNADGSQIIYVCCVKALGAGTETVTFTSGDMSAALNITVA